MDQGANPSNRFEAATKEKNKKERKPIATLGPARLDGHLESSGT